VIRTVDESRMQPLSNPSAAPACAEAGPLEPVSETSTRTRASEVEGPALKPLYVRSDAFLSAPNHRSLSPLPEKSQKILGPRKDSTQAPCPCRKPPIVVPATSAGLQRDSDENLIWKVAVSRNLLILRVFLPNPLFRAMPHPNGDGMRGRSLRA
jgi:hypothetical protein